MKLRVTLLPAGAILLAMAAVSAQGPSGGDFALRKSIIAGGSGQAGGGALRLQGTVGQDDAGSMAGGGFQVQGGFWPEASQAMPPPERLFGDGFES